MNYVVILLRLVALVVIFLMILMIYSRIKPTALPINNSNNNIISILLTRPPVHNVLLNDQALIPFFIGLLDRRLQSMIINIPQLIVLKFIRQITVALAIVSFPTIIVLIMHNLLNPLVFKMTTRRICRICRIRLHQENKKAKTIIIRYRNYFDISVKRYIYGHVNPMNRQEAVAVPRLESILKMSISVHVQKVQM